LTVCICFAAAAVLSGAWVVIHANHVHDHDGAGGCCSVCAQIAAAQNLLKQLGSALKIAVAAFGGLAAASVAFASEIPLDRFLTLAALKVRMNN
jgi:hypothetical protein